jgi:hypothetical protein
MGVDEVYELPFWVRLKLCSMFGGNIEASAKRWNKIPNIQINT